MDRQTVRQNTLVLVWLRIHSQKVTRAGLKDEVSVESFIMAQINHHPRVVASLHKTKPN